MTFSLAAAGLTLAMLTTPIFAKGSDPKGPESCTHGTDDQTFYVDDTIAFNNPSDTGPIRVRFKLRPGYRDNPEKYFMLDEGDFANQIVFDAYIAIITSRLRDEEVGVEPKRKTGTGGDGTEGNPYVLGQISFGKLPGFRVTPPKRK